MNDIIDALIVECNNSVRNAVSGNLIAWCNAMVNIVRTLDGLKAEANKQTNKIEALKAQIQELEKDGAK